MRYAAQILLALAGLALLASGCATHGRKEAPPVFFPPPPDAPRLQFLKSFSTSEDIGEQSVFSRFILGRLKPKPICKPYGIAVHSNSIYVCDTMFKTLEIFDLEKRRMSYFAPIGAGPFSKPVNAAIDEDGTLYVTDSERGQVLIFDSDGKYLAAIGKKAEPRATHPAPAVPKEKDKENEKEESPDTAPGDTSMKPTDVVLSSNRVYIADMRGHCIRVYDKQTREPVTSIPAETTNTEARLFSPTNLARDRQGRLYVCDTGDFRVKMYDADGKFIRSFGKYGIQNGELARPKGVAVDREGRVYVVDAQQETVQVFDPEGQLLLVFGKPGTTPVPLTLPAKVVIDYDHVRYFQKYAAPGFQLEYLVLITNQYGDRKLSVYGFGHQQ